MSLAAFLHSVAISLSSVLTPASLVKRLITMSIAASESFTFSSLRPCASSCFGTRNFFAISSFSSSVYPEMRMISILSCSAHGIV